MHEHSHRRPQTRTPPPGHRVPTLGPPLAPTDQVPWKRWLYYRGEGGETEGGRGGSSCGSLATLIRFHSRGLGCDPGVCRRCPDFGGTLAVRGFLCFPGSERRGHGGGVSLPGPRELAFPVSHPPAVKPQFTPPASQPPRRVRPAA